MWSPRGLEQNIPWRRMVKYLFYSTLNIYTSVDRSFEMIKDQLCISRHHAFATKRFETFSLFH